MVDIKISNKTFFVIVLLGVMLIVTGFSYAYNSDLSASVLGHSAGEIEVNYGGSTATLQDAIDGLSSGSSEEGNLIWFGNVSMRMRNGAYITESCDSPTSYLTAVAESRIQNRKIETRARLRFRSGSYGCNSDWVEGRTASCPYGTRIAIAEVYESGIRAQETGSTGGGCSDLGGIWE